jgi:hypothetical protein
MGSFVRPRVTSWRSEGNATKPITSRETAAQDARTSFRHPQVSIVSWTCSAISLPWSQCSVPDQRTALAELLRVVRPGGQLRFYEHGAATDAHWSRLQRRLGHVWPLFAGGCHLCRDTEQSINEAGF